MQNRNIPILVGIGAMVACLGCGAGSSAFRQGQKAETRKDWDAALVKFETAVRFDSGNARFLIHEKLARAEASLLHLKQGRAQLAQGRQEEAEGELQKAVSIDPTNEAAAQELTRLLVARAAAMRARESDLREALKAEDQISPGVQLKALPSEPIGHFRLSGESKTVFDSLARLAGLSIAYASDFQSRQVSLDLTNVRLEDALRMVCFQTKTFWKAITPNMILVIPDTPSNRQDFAEEDIRTIYLSSPLPAADRAAITTTLKQILGLQKIVDNPDSNSIVIRDTPERIAAAEKMIRELDRGRAEILVDVAVLEADSSRVRDLGITPGTSAALAFTPRSGGTSGSLRLNKLQSLSSADYSITLPGAIATALLSDSRTHIIVSPKIRVTEGQTAKLRIGSRVPYATGSFLPSLGGVGGTGGSFGLLASTQFQYQDVGVNLDLTPVLLPSGGVSLHALIEVSSLGPPLSIGGFSQPTFNQRRIEHDIRLREGEASLLGGLIQSTETKAVSGWPGLGQIPILGNLFSTGHRERTETEVVVMLLPRVIRLPERALEAGKRLSTTDGSLVPPTDSSPSPELSPEQPQTRQ